MGEILSVFSYLLYEDNEAINKRFMYEVYDLKIIGTLQENPELLKEIAKCK